MVAPAIKARRTRPTPRAAAQAAAQRPARAGPRKGRIQRNFKISIDVLMLGLFLYLMSYHPGGGLLWHAILGCVLVLLFVLHHALNWHWHRTLLSGRYNLRRGLTTGTDVLLLLAMGAVIVSSYKIASMALPFEFLPPPRGWWRDLHMAATAWCFVLMAFHLGLHLHNTLIKWERQLSARGAGARVAFWGLELLVLVGGGYSFWYHHLGSDLLMVPTRPLSLPDWLFYSEFALIIMGFAVVTHGLLTALTPPRSTPRRSMVRPH